jgi:hypothetical protein
MVDGKTINQLRMDLNSLSEEMKKLKKYVLELEERTKNIEVLHHDELLALNEKQKK